MAQITLPFTLVAGTPENVNNVQSNFVQIKDHINNALIGTDNITDASLLDTDLASPNNSVWRPVFTIGGSRITDATVAGTYLLTPSSGVNPASTASAIPLWTPNTADVAVAGKTTQVRVVANIAVNGTAPAVNLTIGLYPVTASAGASSATLSFTLSVVQMSASYTTPAAGALSRSAGSAVSLSALPVSAHVLAVVVSGTVATNSLVSMTASVEMRHN